MIVSQDNGSFKPVTIILETLEEFQVVKALTGQFNIQGNASAAKVIYELYDYLDEINNFDQDFIWKV